MILYKKAVSVDLLKDTVFPADYYDSLSGKDINTRIGHWYNILRRRFKDHSYIELRLLATGIAIEELKDRKISTLRDESGNLTKEKNLVYFWNLSGWRTSRGTLRMLRSISTRRLIHYRCSWY